MCCSARPRTATFWRRPNGRVMSMTSPILISRCGLADCPLRATLPPSHAFFASERVLNRQLTSSQTSRRIAESYAGRPLERESRIAGGTGARKTSLKGLWGRLRRPSGVRQNVGMPTLNLEHIACNVAEPAAMAAWYVEHVGMRVARHAGGPSNIHFLSD